MRRLFIFILFCSVSYLKSFSNTKARDQETVLAWGNRCQVETLSFLNYIISPDLLSCKRNLESQKFSSNMNWASTRKWKILRKWRKFQLLWSLMEAFGLISRSSTKKPAGEFLKFFITYLLLWKIKYYILENTLTLNKRKKFFCLTESFSTIYALRF